jgi:tryptophan synthase alpha chain
MVEPSPSRFEAGLRARIAAGGKLLVPFLTAGFPDPERYAAALRSVVDAGADAVEIGIPFSDPLADGPTIQRASQRSLDSGVTLRGTLAAMERESTGGSIPIVLMTYMNPIHAMGSRVFCRAAADAGVAGVLVSDLPPEEMPEFGTMLKEHGMDRIILIAPTTHTSRIESLARHASGYLYMVTRTGVTGAGGSFSEHLSAQRSEIRKVTDLPVVAGFGIRRVEDMTRVGDSADGFVIGARLLELIEECESAVQVAATVAEFLGPLRRFLDKR